jgi:DNA-binding transcriptional MerR regulator
VVDWRNANGKSGPGRWGERANHQVLRTPRTLPSAAREANGYRHYDEASASRSRFIRASQAAGLSLTDLSSIVTIRQAGETPCEHVTTLLAGKLEAERARQRELALLESELQQLIGASENLNPAGWSRTTPPTHTHRATGWIEYPPWRSCGF